MESIILLRLIHIVCSVFWTVAMIYLAAFVFPAAKSLGSDGFKFIKQLSTTNKLPILMNAAAILTIVTGVYLMDPFSAGSSHKLFDSTYSIIISTGAILTLVGFLIGISINFPAALRINARWKKLEGEGAPINPWQLPEIQKLYKKLSMATNVTAILLFASLILMSIVRYF
jgi:uncharacterized membrane protein